MTSPSTGFFDLKHNLHQNFNAHPDPDYVEPGNPINRNTESIENLKKELESAKQTAKRLDEELSEELKLNKNLKQGKPKENLKEGKLRARLSAVNKFIKNLNQALEIKEMLATLSDLAVDPKLAQAKANSEHNPRRNNDPDPNYVEPGNPISRNDESIEILKKELKSAEQKAEMLNKELLNVSKLKGGKPKEKKLEIKILETKLSAVNKFIKNLNKALEIKEILVTLEEELALLTNPKNPNPAKSPSGQKP